jgi:hypothetical protein
MHPSHICSQDDAYDGNNKYCIKPHDAAGLPVEIFRASVTDGGPSQFRDPSVSRLPAKYYSINDNWQEDGHPYISVHPKCLESAERVVDLKKSVLGNNAERYEAIFLTAITRFISQSV